MDAANRRGITQFSQQRAKTHSPTGTTRNAWKPKCSWAGTDNDPGGIAPACWLGGNFGSPHRIETGSALESRLNSGQLNHVSFVFGQPDRNVVAANTISIQGSIPPPRPELNLSPFRVNRVTLAVGRLLPVFPCKRTSSGQVSMSQKRRIRCKSLFGMTDEKFLGRRRALQCLAGLKPRPTIHRTELVLRTRKLSHPWANYRSMTTVRSRSSRFPSIAAIVSGDSNSPSLTTAVFRSGSTRCWADPTV